MSGKSSETLAGSHVGDGPGSLTVQQWRDGSSTICLRLNIPRNVDTIPLLERCIATFKHSLSMTSDEKLSRIMSSIEGEKVSAAPASGETSHV